MEDILNKYYNIIYDEIDEYNDLVKIYYKDDIFILKSINHNHINFIDVNNNTYYPIVINKSNKYFSEYKGTFYILFKVDKRYLFDTNDILNISNNIISIGSINWINLWQHKVDYIENALGETTNYLISESKDYFIGLAEYAIIFLNFNKDHLSDKKIVECRYRINEYNYRYPDNIVYDCQERDIAEYIKYLLIEKNESFYNIETIVNKAYYMGFDVILIIARVIYPSYYFDLIDEFQVNSVFPEKKFLHIIHNSNRVENLINKLINKYIKKRN